MTLREALERAHAEHVILLNDTGNYYYPLDVLDVCEIEAPKLLDQKVYLGYGGIWPLDASGNLKSAEPLYSIKPTQAGSE